MSSIKKGVDSINNNFKSIKKEYAILCIYGSGTPFYLDKYDSYEKAKFHLLDMVSLEKERGRPYYVDNDFYENEYTQNVKGKYFCIKERDVTKWEKTYESRIKTKDNNKNKIYYFENYI